MRITKNIREYIEKAVSERVEKKYADEIKTAERNRDIRNIIQEEAKQRAIEAARAYIDSKLLEVADIIEPNAVYQDEDFPLLAYRRFSVLDLKDECMMNSVYHAKDRMRNEVKEIVQNIIVELELGGNKADLDRMLSEI